MRAGPETAIHPPLPDSPGRLSAVRGLWAVPLALSLVFVLGVLAWMERTDREERDEARKTMISDALSLDAQIRAAVDAESGMLAGLAQRLSARGTTPDGFVTDAEVLKGLRRFWQSITWLDENNRILAHVPEPAPLPEPGVRAGMLSEQGLSAHLLAPVPQAHGALVARYSPGAVLRRSVPWWLARKYDVRFVDTFGEVVASTGDSMQVPGRDSYRVSFEPTLRNVYLELTARDVIAPWYRSLPVALMAGFLVLVTGATALLRRQMQAVRRAEAAWRTEAAWRSAMEDSLRVGLRARDFDGRLVYVNRAFAQMIGYSPDEMLGMRPPMPYWPPEEIEQSMQRYQRNMAGLAPREGYEAHWLHRNGQRVEVMIFEAPLVDARGVQIGWMGSILDVTERKRMEERERRQTDTAAHNARLTMLGEIASTLAHELNQPLTAIASYNAGVINSLNRHDGADPVLLGALQRLGEQAGHAGRIVQRIREFLTRRSPQREACDLNAVLASAVHLLRRELARHAVSLDLHPLPNLPLVMADPVLVEQVVINLIRNACDALAGRPQPRRINVSSQRAGEQFARIDVRDNGPGLAGRSIEQLTQPFYSTKPEGMGMGLAICSTIIEAHQGAFDASDNPDGGARFSLSLPLAGRLTNEADVQVNDEALA